MKVHLAAGTIDPDVHTPESVASALQARDAAKQRKAERRQAALALLKQRAEKDPVIEAIITVLEL